VVNAEESNEKGVEFYVVLSTINAYFEGGLYMSLGHSISSK
jgi:hypothetical protein